MRRYVLILGGVEALIWLGVTLWAARQPARVDISGLHGFFVICTLPGLALGLLDRAPKTAVTLVSIDAFVLLSVAMASRIAN